MEKIIIREVEYEIHELLMGDVIDLFAGDDEARSTGIEMAKRAVFISGESKPIDDGFLKLPFSTGQKLLAAVTRVNSLQGETDELGNEQ